MKAAETTPAIDLTQLKIISRGNKEFVEKMLALFKNVVPKSINGLSMHMKEKNWKKVSDIAHSLKPTIDTLGINLRQNIRDLEKTAKAGNDVAAIQSLTEKVIVILQEALIDVDHELNSIKK